MGESDFRNVGQGRVSFSCQEVPQWGNKCGALEFPHQLSPAVARLVNLTPPVRDWQTSRVRRALTEPPAVPPHLLLDWKVPGSTSRLCRTLRPSWSPRNGRPDEDCLLRLPVRQNPSKRLHFFRDTKSR